MILCMPIFCYPFRIVHMNETVKKDSEHNLAESKVYVGYNNGVTDVIKQLEEFS